MHSSILVTVSLLLAAVKAAQLPATTTTTLVVIPATPAPITFTASRVPDSSKYASLATPTTITINGRPTSIFPKGFVWAPVSSVASAPSVPIYLWPSFGNQITVTATTGTPPPTVTFTTSQIPSLTSLKSTTTSNGIVIFPFGLIWVPIVGPVPLPPTLPAIPSDYIPPEPTSTPDPTPTSGCSSKTPVVTVVISYPTDSYGDFQTTTSTKSATDKDGCLAKATTATSTITPPPVKVLIQTQDATDIDDEPIPDLGPVAPAVLSSLVAELASLRYGAPATATKKCAASLYASVVPTAAAFIGGLAPSFCRDWAAAPTRAFSKSYSAKDVKSNKRAELKPRRPRGKRTPPPAALTPNSYPGWSVKYTWTPEKTAVSENCNKIDYCNAQEKAMLANCEGYSLADAYSGGSIQDGCGTFTYEIEKGPHLDFRCASAPNPTFSKYMNRDDAIEAITNFCKAHDGKSVTKGTSGYVETVFSATFAGQCAGDGSGAYKIEQKDCIDALTRLVDNCDTNTRMYKHGGTVTEVNSCAVFSFTPGATDHFACWPQNRDMKWIPYQNEVGISSAMATDAISQFCDRGGKDQTYTLYPDKSKDWGSFADPQSFTGNLCTAANLAECGYYYRKDGSRVTGTGDLGDINVRLSAYYVPGSDCGPKKQYAIHGDQCKMNLSKLIGVESGQCPAGKDGKYTLGSFVESGPHGCVMWTMYATNTH